MHPFNKIHFSRYPFKESLSPWLFPLRRNSLYEKLSPRKMSFLQLALIEPNLQLSSQKDLTLSHLINEGFLNHRIFLKENFPLQPALKQRASRRITATPDDSASYKYILFKRWHKGIAFRIGKCAIRRQPECMTLALSFLKLLLFKPTVKAGGGCVNDIIIIIKYWVVPLQVSRCCLSE